MKTRSLAILLNTISTIVHAQNLYYVSTNGNNPNNGTTISTPWKTVTYAASSASPVSPGDTVFIEAGNYGNEYVVFETDGTATDKITFEGYQTVPGDNIYTFDPEFFDMDNNDYHLMVTSPCVDAGTIEGAPLSDFDGNIRPMRNGVDIGPYENTIPVGIDDLYSTEVSSVNQVIIYPNPATDQITIESAESNLSEIKLFDLLGQDITKLSQKININKTSAIIDITNLSSGIYMVKTNSLRVK